LSYFNSVERKDAKVVQPARFVQLGASSHVS